MLVGLKVANSANLAFAGLELNSVGATDPYYPFRVQNSQNLSFTNLDVHGNRNAPPSSQRWGFLATDNKHIRFDRCHFHHMWGGLTANNNADIDISNNTFSDIDKGALEMGGSSWVNISNNYFTDFRVDRGTHPDAIQIYTAGTHNIAHDIKVTGNLYYRGSGDAVQGIFIQDEVGTLPFHNVTVDDNAVIGGMWNSIYVKHATGDLRVTDNIAASWVGVDMPGIGTPAAEKTAPTTTHFSAFLFLRDDLSGANLIVSGNRAQTYMDRSGRRMSPPRGNNALGEINDHGAALLKAWAAKHPGNPRFDDARPVASLARS
jgi:hypothetical protein